MSREKQIYDIREIIANCDDVPSNVCRFKPCSLCKAERLYNAGYRKQSENVIEVPCKIGDTVYVVSQGAGFSCVWNVYKSRVTAIHLDRYNKLFVFTETERENVGGYVEVERVFNTKEEAEQALEKIIEKMKGGAE